MSVLTDKFDVVIDGVHYPDLAAVPERFEPLVRSAIADAEVRRAGQLEMLAAGERLRIELNSSDANFSVAADFSITWNGQQYPSYDELPVEAKDALLANPVFPDLDEDGVPDFFQHPVSEDPAEQRKTFKVALRQNREAQAILAAKDEAFAPDFPGYELATFHLTIDGRDYRSLADVPEASREAAQRLIVEFLRRRAENGGDALTEESVVRLSDSGLAPRPAPVGVADATATEPAAPIPVDMADKIAEISARNAAVKAEMEAIAPSPIEQSSASRVAIMVMLSLGLVAAALVITIIVLLAGA